CRILPSMEDSFGLRLVGPPDHYRVMTRVGFAHTTFLLISFFTDSSFSFARNSPSTSRRCSHSLRRSAIHSSATAKRWGAKRHHRPRPFFSQVINPASRSI